VTSRRAADDTAFPGKPSSARPFAVARADRR
jgi:hypothetical protein